MTTKKKPEKKPVRKAVNSREKGAKYERHVAAKLGEWWGEEFHRTPSSGGLGWANDSRVVGDVVTPSDSLFPYVIECKKREKWDMLQWITETGEMETWWAQVLKDSAKLGIKPFLIYTRNFQPDFGMLYVEDFEPILKNVPRAKRINSFVVHNLKGNDRVIFLLDEFLEFVTREDIIASYNLKV